MLKVYQKEQRRMITGKNVCIKDITILWDKGVIIESI